MDLHHDNILNEIDSLLTKLETLPSDVRLQALQKLSQKVSVSRSRGRGRGRGKGRGRGRGRGRGSVISPSSPSFPSFPSSSQTSFLDPIQGVEVSDAATPIKLEPPEGAEAELEATEGLQPGVRGRESHRGRRRGRGLSLQDIVVSGRRSTKRVDYRQLAEYGYDEDGEGGSCKTEQVPQELTTTTTTTTTTPSTTTTTTTTTTTATTLMVKRRRGRPRKNPLPPNPPSELKVDSNLLPNLLDKALDSLALHTCNETPTPAATVPEGVTGTVAAEQDALDLLESCLKESGIKTIDSDPPEAKPEIPDSVDLKTIMEEDEKEEEEEEEEVICIDKEVEEEEEEEEEDAGQEPNVKLEELEGYEEGVKEEVLVCDSVESVTTAPKKSTVKSQFKCDECGKMYSTLSILKSHKIRHRDKKDLPFHCDKCDFTAASKIELFRHSYKHSDAQLYICEICGNTFSRDTSLREHIEYVHTRTRRLKCAQCGYVTNRRQTMKKHLLSHDGVRPVIACPICGVTFRSRRNLKTHLYSHVGAKPFECDECDKKFILKNRLVVHKQQVHGPRSYKCTDCVKTFPTHHHLQRHLRVHTGEKPYKCCFCAFTCNTQGNLIKHIRQIHEKVSFSYKDCLRVTRNVPKLEPVDDGELMKLSEEGREVAKRLLPKLEGFTGQPLSLDTLVEQVKKEKEEKAQYIQEQLMRKKKRNTRKSAAPKTVPSLASSGEEGKVTLYAMPGASDGSGEGMEPLMDDQVYIENGLANLGESQYLLTQPDDGGCVMIIPWDVSLIEEEEEEEEAAAWGGERREGKEDASDVMGVKVSKDGGITNLESLELDVDSKRTSKDGSDDAGKIIEVRELVGTLGKALGDKTKPLNITADKTFPESIQVIASNEPVDDPSPQCSNLVLPEGYIFDPSGQVIHLSDAVLDGNLLLRQTVRGDTPEVTINKITSNVYSLMSQGSNGDNGETFVITTQDGEDGEEEEEEGGVMQGVESVPARVDLQNTEDEEDRQAALVLIVNAEDLDN